MSMNLRLIDPEHFHHFVAEGVDYLDRDAA